MRAVFAFGLLALSAEAQPQLPKILVLHGGGESLNSQTNTISFQEHAGMRHLMNSLAFEFVFAFAPGYSNQPQCACGGTGPGTWSCDAAGDDKTSATTTDTNIAIRSVTYLNTFVADRGPFVGILGYSQGSAFIPYYLSVVPEMINNFQFAVLFCGYRQTQHEGIIASISAAFPLPAGLNIPSIVYHGLQDIFNSTSQWDSLGPTLQGGMSNLVQSPEGGHSLPTENAVGFTDIVSFISSNYDRNTVISANTLPACSADCDCGSTPASCGGGKDIAETSGSTDGKSTSGSTDGKTPKNTGKRLLFGIKTSVESITHAGPGTCMSCACLS